jgi:hypothetical protein
MPIEQAPVRLQDINLDAPETPLRWEGRGLTDLEALSLVTNQFNSYEWYRQQNHDRRWNLHDSLYYGWVPPKVWDGTTVARSSLGMPIVFDQVESARTGISTPASSRYQRSNDVYS